MRRFTSRRHCQFLKGRAATQCCAFNGEEMMKPVKLSVAVNLVGMACLCVSLLLRHILDLDGASALMLLIALPLLLAAVVLAINGR